jgi:hypothetical protein
MWMIANASYTDGSSYRGQILNRGDLSTTYAEISRVSCYTHQKKLYRLSYNGTRKMIKWFKDQVMIAVRPYFFGPKEEWQGVVAGGSGRGSVTGGGLIVSILNYDTYQPGLVESVTGGQEQGVVAGGSGRQEPNKLVTKVSPSGDTDTPSPPPPTKKDLTVPCPHLKIVALWNKTMPTPCVQIVGWTEARRKLLRAIWKAYPQMQSLGAWQALFTKCTESQFLMGKANSSITHRQFKFNIDWLLNPNNFVKVIELKYHDATTRQRAQEGYDSWMKYMNKRGTYEARAD